MVKSFYRAVHENFSKPGVASSEIEERDTMRNQLAERLSEMARRRPQLTPQSTAQSNLGDRQQTATRGNAPSRSARTTRFTPVAASDVLDAFANAGTVTAEDCRRARELAHSTGNSLSTVVDRLGLISQADWARETAELCGLELATAADFPVPLPAQPRLSSAFMKARNVAPLEITDFGWCFAVADPADPFVEKALAIACDGAVALKVAAPRDIEAALARTEAEADRAGLMSDRGRDEQDRDYLVELANDAPTIKLVDRILSTAMERGATDIHVEAFDRMTRVRYRIDGLLVDQPAVPPDLYAGVVSRLKILAGLDIAERRLPQDGRIRYRAHGREVDLRVATAPAIHGEALALRLLNTDIGLKSIASIDMPAGVRAIFERGLAQRNGLILVTGPTGSGKTTTLHAALGQLNTVGRKIVAVENPVEIQVPGVVQVEANSDIGLDFARALRSFLRHDPDVMMVGEIRDRETAEVAIQAALTGHLVLSTLHTNDAPSAVTRLEDMGIERFLINATLRVAAAQRLVRVLCQHCARPSRPGDLGYKLTASNAAREAVGCPHCSGSGYRGRRAVFEAVEGAHLVTDVGADPGRYEPMRTHALELIAAGVTSGEEALRAIELPDGDLERELRSDRGGGPG